MSLSVSFCLPSLVLVDDSKVRPHDMTIISNDMLYKRHLQVQETQQILEAKLRKQQQESEVDSKWLQQEENNLKKRLSLITSAAGGASFDQQPQQQQELNNGSGSLSGSYHSQQSPHFSPQNTMSGPQSLGDHYPTTPNTSDSR